MDITSITGNTDIDSILGHHQHQTSWTDNTLNITDKTNITAGNTNHPDVSEVMDNLNITVIKDTTG
jgi:hypothetical protein